MTTAALLDAHHKLPEAPPPARAIGVPSVQLVSYPTGLGARIPREHDTQTLDDKPPAACCAWGARRPCTELQSGWTVLLCRTAPGLPDVRAVMSTP
jgi:hypothetical protein